MTPSNGGHASTNYKDQYFIRCHIFPHGLGKDFIFPDRLQHTAKGRFDNLVTYPERNDAKEKNKEKETVMRIDLQAKNGRLRDTPGSSIGPPVNETQLFM